VIGSSICGLDISGEGHRLIASNYAGLLVIVEMRRILVLCHAVVRTVS
jgi:hypothetical protein